jgi:hypothetical protein
MNRFLTVVRDFRDTYSAVTHAIFEDEAEGVSAVEAGDGTTK